MPVTDNCARSLYLIITYKIDTYNFTDEETKTHGVAWVAQSCTTGKGIDLDWNSGECASLTHSTNCYLMEPP